MENKPILEFLSSPFKVMEGKVKEIFVEKKSAPFEMADVKTGEVNFFQKITKVSKATIDTSNYAKYYKGNTHVIYKLSPPALLMYNYIVNELGIHTDLIVLESDCYCSIMECSDKTFRRAILELLEKNIIARKKGSSIEFFVNINYVFNGSRLKLKG
jgi:hypothetical protein